MSTFVAVPFDGWPLIAEALTASGQPWPEAAAVADLRWWTAEAARELGLLGLSRVDLTDEHRRAIRAGLPGRPALVARWGWTDWAVKGLRANPALWWQDERWGAQPQDSASAPPARRQRSASPPPAEERKDAENHDDSASPPPALRQPAASGPPSRVPSFTEREEFREAEEQRATPPPPPVPSTELQAAELLALQQRDEPQHGTGQPRDHDALRRALARGTQPEALAALWAWSGVSEDPLVGACRTGGWRRWSSLLRAPTGEERIRAAVAWHAAGRPVEQRARGRPPVLGLAPHNRRDPGPPPDPEPATDDDLATLYRDHPELRPTT